MNFVRSLAAAAFALIPLAPVAEAATVNATGNITNNVIFGSGVTNGAFTGVTVGGLELALRAKLRYDNTSACGGVGCAQNIYNYDGMSTYTFDSSLSHTPANRSLFNFEWAINSNANGTGGALNSYSYRIDIDTDPTWQTASSVSYNPMSLFSTGYYLGTNASPQGGATFRVGGTGNLGAFNIAQNSVNMSFLPGTRYTSGAYRITLSAFSGSSKVASTSIHVIVDAPAPIPLPAGLPLLGGALAGMTALKRRNSRARRAA